MFAPAEATAGLDLPLLPQPPPLAPPGLPLPAVDCFLLPPGQDAAGAGGGSGSFALHPGMAEAMRADAAPPKNDRRL